MLRPRGVLRVLSPLVEAQIPRPRWRPETPASFDGLPRYTLRLRLGSVWDGSSIRVDGHIQGRQRVRGQKAWTPRVDS